MIEVEKLTKDYGTVVAVRDVSFRVGRGEVVGFLGPNGAGKSTTLRILAGFLGATSGSVRVNGFDLTEDSIGARRSLGYMPESSPLYPELRVREYLAFRASLKEVAAKERKRAVERAMDQAGVRHMSETLIGHLSKGYRQRVGLADALVASAPLLVLDEPTAGLDPNQIREVRKLVRALGEEHTILLSTHILPEVESVCRRAIVIDRGRLVAEGTLEELGRERQGRGADFTLRDPDDRAHALVSAAAGVKKVKRVGRDGEVSRLRVSFQSDVDVAAALERLVNELVGAGLGVRSAAPTKASLEEVFAQLTRADATENES